MLIYQAAFRRITPLSKLEIAKWQVTFPVGNGIYCDRFLKSFRLATTRCYSYSVLDKHCYFVAYHRLQGLRLLDISCCGLPHLRSNGWFSASDHQLLFSQRSLHTSTAVCDKDKSKVEQTVSALKDSLKTKKDDRVVSSVEVAEPVVKTEVAIPPKKTITQRVIDELKHYYHGFRLLFIDISVSARLLVRILNGEVLTRREHKLLVRTVSDIFRLVPFSVFIIVPFMEFLLPVFIKLFPNMLPSTFQSSSDREAKMKKSLKVKLEMAKFLQDTLDEMAVQSKGDKKSQTAREFSQFFERIRSSGQQASNEDIIRFSKLFEDEITLDSLNRPQLIALCKLLELKPLGTTNFLRFQLRMRLRSLIADDKMINKEGVGNLDSVELQQACKARGMRAYGVSDERMKSQLEQWLELSLNEKIPPSLLLLSRALYIPETLPAADKLKATISTLPDSVATQAKAKIGDMEGKIDNKTQIELIREEQKHILQEKEEKKQEQMASAIPIPDKFVEMSDGQLSDLKRVPATAEQLVDQAPVVYDAASEIIKEVQSEKMEAELTSKDLDVIEDALENIAAEKQKLLIEKEELKELKDEMADYEQDMEELKDVVVLSGLSEKELRVSKASVRLYKQVNKMVKKMDHIIDNLEKKGDVLKMKLGQDADQEKQKHVEELVTIDELVQSIRKLQNRPDVARLEKIADVLEEIDEDRDGVVKVDDVLQMIDLIGKEDVKLNDKQLSEIISLLEKEETLEFLERIEKHVEREAQQKSVKETISEERSDAKKSEV